MTQTIADTRIGTGMSHSLIVEGPAVVRWQGSYDLPIIVRAGEQITIVVQAEQGTSRVSINRHVNSTGR